MSDPAPTPTVAPATAPKRGMNRGCVIGAVVAIALLCVCIVLFGTLGGGYLLVSQLSGTPTAKPLYTAVAPTEVRRTSTPAVRETRTSAPTPPRRTSTPSNGDAGATWPVILSDAFVSNDNEWKEGTSTTDSGTHNHTFESGKYRWEAKTSKGTVRWVTPKMDSFSDMYVMAEAKRVSGPTNFGYGVAFRVDDDGNFYVFDIGDDRKFYVGLYDQGSWTDLIDSTTSSAIRPGAVNRLAVSASGSHFVFYINDQKVGEVDDSTIFSGQGGLALDLQADQNVVVDFSKFELRAP